MNQRIHGSHGKVVWSKEHGLVSLELDEDVSALVQGAEVSRHRQHLVARQIPVQTVDLPETLAEANTLLRTPTVAPGRFYEIPPQLVAELTELTTEDAFARYQARFVEGPAASTSLIRHYVRLRPDAARDLTRRFDRLEPTKENARRVGHFYGALGSAGHREAQLAMAEVLEDGSYSALSRDLAARGTLGVPQPLPELARALWSYRQTLATDRADALTHRALVTNVYGALGGVEHAAPEVTREVVRTLGGELVRAASRVERLHLLTALGNVGDLDEVLPLTESYLRSPDPDLRRRAFHTFQKAAGEAAFARFAGYFEKERDAGVRRAAVAIAQVMPDSPALAAWTRRRALSETDLSSRARLAAMLGDGLRDHPDNEAVLRTLLDTESDREVRKVIYRYLSPAATGGAR